MPPIESWLLEVLACPRCHERVTLTAGGDGLRCARCRVVYPIDEGIPQMLPESGRPEDGSPKDAK